MRWEKDDLANIQALLLSSDENNQLIGLELVQQGELWEGFAPLLTFLTFADADRTNILATAKDILSKMKLETQTHWNDVCRILGYDIYNPGKIQNFEKYIIVFDGFVKKAPRFSCIYTSLGKKLINVHSNYSKGIEYLRKAADFNSNDYIANFEYASHLELSIFNADKIIKYYTRCLNLNNSAYALYFNIGKTYFIKQDYAKGIEIFREGLTKHPQRADNMIDIALDIKRKGKVSESRKILELALEIKPHSHLAHNNLAFLLWNSLQEYDLAMEHILKALEILPTHALYWHTLAEVEWYGFKNKEKALAALYKAKDCNKNYTGGDAMIKELESI